MVGNIKRGVMTKFACFPVMGQMRHFGLLQSAIDQDPKLRDSTFSNSSIKISGHHLRQ
jgi:hypothetical protein